MKKKNYKYCLSALSCAVVLGVTGCSSIDNWYANTSGTVACAAGGMFGAALGAGTAMLSGGSNKHIIAGATIGAVAGCGMSYAYQSRVKAIQDLAKEEGMTIEVEELKSSDKSQPGGGFVAITQDGDMFAVGSHQLSTNGRRQILKLASIFASSSPTAQQPKLLVVGHTDATGSAAFNQGLSERRAKTVGKVLALVGIPTSNIYFQGAGSSRPIADNTLLAGRDKNRRVEIVEVTDENMLALRINDEINNLGYLVHTTNNKPTIPATAGRNIKKATPRVDTALSPISKKAPQSNGESKSTNTDDTGFGPVANETPSSATQSTKTAAQATSQVNSSNTSARDKQVAGASERVQQKNDTIKRQSAVSAASTASVNFGGALAADYQGSLGVKITPKVSGFSLISKAEASEIPISSCLEDMPRQQGEVINLATNKPLESHKTREYLPGYNNVVWANLVNGHLVTLSPVSILRKNAAIDRQPLVQVVKDYDKGNRKALTNKYVSIANTYEGETEILYRVFMSGKNAPVSCMDVVFSKGNARAEQGVLFYSDRNQPYIAQYQPIINR